MAKRGRSTKPVKETAASVADILNLPGISPEQLYLLKLMPVSRNGIYDACNRGEIECFRLGRKIIIPTAPLRRKLGMEAV